MARDDKKTSPAPKNGGVEKRGRCEKRRGPAEGQDTSDADRSKAESGETAANSPSGYSRGEGQIPVSKAYRDNWNAIFAKKKRRSGNGSMDRFRRSAARPTASIGHHNLQPLLIACVIVVEPMCPAAPFHPNNVQYRRGKATGGWCATDRLAGRLGVAAAEIAIHRFRDGELGATIVPPTPVTIIYASLDQPNEKLVALLFASKRCAAMAPSGSFLVAPYLCYMRQDIAFQPGEAISKRPLAGS